MKRQSFDVVWRVVAGVVAAYLVAVLAIWWWWDAEPDQFDVKALAESAARESGDRAVVLSNKNMRVNNGDSAS
ncbi:MAG: DUF2333 family protein [Gammaproteobacteria bacterium]|nr:DUF2333 family protein [Gammaproteobacteria bacterium]